MKLEIAIHYYSAHPHVDLEKFNINQLKPVKTLLNENINEFIYS